MYWVQHFACSFKFLTTFQISTSSSAASEVKPKSKKKKKSTLPVSFSQNNPLTLLSQLPRQSTDKWSQALAKAHAAQNALADVDRKQADCEELVEGGLELLFERFVIFTVSALPFF